MFGLGTGEIVIVLVIALLVFGPQKLPEIGRQIGGLMREFRRMSDDVRRTFDIDDYNYNHPAAEVGGAASYPRLDQQDLSESYVPYSGDAAATTHKPGAQAYDSPRPWSFTDEAHENAGATFAPVSTIEPPGPPSAVRAGIAVGDSQP